MGLSSQDAFAEWDDERYSVDIDRFDEQHKRLFGLLNDLHTAMDEGHSEEKVGDILRELERYTEYHFGDEEEFMQDCGYAMDCADCFYNHREMHEEFADRVSELREKHENGEHITVEVLQFVRDWLDSHIGASDVDQSYGEYYREEIEDYEYSPGQLKRDRRTARDDATDASDEDRSDAEFDVTVAGDVYQGGDLSIPDGPMAAWFDGLVERYGERTAALLPRDGQYVERTFADLDERARAVAAGLLDAGFAPGDRLAVQAASQYEWSVVDLACQMAGLVSVPLYQWFDPERAVDVVEAADVAGLVSDPETPVAVEEAVDSVIQIEELPTAAARTLPGFEADADDVATIVYDAAETDEQSGCELTHRNLLTAVASLTESLPLDPGATGTCILPLAHVYQRVATYYLWEAGGGVAYVGTDDVVSELTEIQPTVLIGTPQVYQELYGEFQDRIGDLGWMKRKLAGRVASYGRGMLDGSGTPLKYSAAKRLVFGPLREAVGLGDLEYALASVGSLDDHLQYFFRGFGVPVSELYGPVESAGVATLNHGDSFQIDSVGRPMPGTELARSEEGTVLVRGPNVTAGCLDEQATKRSLHDGWLHTGDAGEFDADGALRLDGR
ncbi:bacteriohemerythrin [Halorientalis brevis]|uniref:Bacteriohemerythrin n=1 Tax=Halorientalis brevis TaxID=1126241 RepID=A0ABD6CH50_9EURY|nr:bacteriohemerythrin [Halorientalis brevis]